MKLKSSQTRSGCGSASPQPAGPAVPHAERFIQTLQCECLNRFIVMGTGHLDHLLGEYLQHYNTERPHSGIGHRMPVTGVKPLRLNGARGPVRYRTRLGGMLRSYERVAG